MSGLATYVMKAFIIVIENIVSVSARINNFGLPSLMTPFFQVGRRVVSLQTQPPAARRRPGSAAWATKKFPFLRLDRTDCGKPKKFIKILSYNPLFPSRSGCRLFADPATVAPGRPTRPPGTEKAA